jgi:hypothetical protein
MESTTTQQKSGGKVKGESTGLPKQNSRANLNDTSPRKDGQRHGMKSEGGGAAKTGYTRESM